MVQEQKSIFLQRIEGTKAFAHLLIAQLALISSKGINIAPIYSDGNAGPLFTLDIPYLLRQLQYFSINEFDKSSHYKFPLEPAVQLLEGNQRDKLIQLLFNNSLIIPIVRIFELLKEYCNSTDQFEKFKSQDWFNVAWIIRNSFSHDFVLNIANKSKLNEIPFKWKGIKITQEMLGTPLKYPNSSIKNLTMLFDTMTAFSRELD